MDPAASVLEFISQRQQNKGELANGSGFRFQVPISTNHLIPRNHHEIPLGHVSQNEKVFQTDIDDTSLTSSSIKDDQRKFVAPNESRLEMTEEADHTFNAPVKRGVWLDKDIGATLPHFGQSILGSESGDDDDSHVNNTAHQIQQSRNPRSTSSKRMPSSKRVLANTAKTAIESRRLEENHRSGAKAPLSLDSSKSIVRERAANSRTTRADHDAECDKQRRQTSLPTVSRVQRNLEEQTRTDLGHGRVPEKPAIPRSGDVSVDEPESKDLQLSEDNNSKGSLVHGPSFLRSRVKDGAKEDPESLDSRSIGHRENSAFQDRRPTKRSRSLDYQIEDLKGMTYQALRNQDFDHDPTSDQQELPAKLVTGTIGDKLDHLFLCRQNDLLHRQGALFFASLNIADYETCGDAIIEQFTQIMSRFKSVRRQKRQACEAFEDEIHARQELIKSRRDIISADMKIMHQKGKDIVPKKIKLAEST